VPTAVPPIRVNAHQNGAHIQAAMDKLEAKLNEGSEPITQELHKPPGTVDRDVA
jgi:hypothetical protein